MKTKLAINEYLIKNNMKTKLAINGHPTRNKEVIKLLKILGGKVLNDCECNNPNIFYYILDGHISWDYLGLEEIDKYKIFTLDQFLEKYPFKVGDKVFDTADGDPGTIAEMKWDEDVSDMKYRIAFDNGDMGWFTIDTFGFLKKDKNLELEKMSVKNHKMGPKSKLPSKYYEDRLKEIQTKRDMDNTIFMIGPVIVPDKVDDKLEYKIPDDYEFSVVVDGKIILKPIKPKYQTTYEECREMLPKNEYYEFSVFMTLQNLIICRNAYWEIAGEQMGLGKPWKPDDDTEIYNIYRIKNTIRIGGACWGGNCNILEFPTEDMRDAFYENFKDMIESCKELL